MDVYVISLNTAKERQKRFRQRFIEAGAEIDHFYWYYATRNNENPEKGCFDSHNQVLKIAKERGDKYALVFEDDAVFIGENNWGDVKKIIEKFIKFAPDNWSYFSLGYLPIRTRITQYPDIVEILCAHDAHAYLINVENAKILEYNGTMFDSKVFCQGIKALEFNKYNYKTGINVYGANPMLFKQELEDSSIHKYHLTQGNLIDFYQGENGILNISKYVNILQLMWLSIISIIFGIILIVLILIWHFAPEKITKQSFIIWLVCLLFVGLIFSIIFGTNFHSVLQL